MQTSLTYFLVAAEELNISSAAKKLFISQQCLSEHIQKLEEKYHTKFFYRSPQLSLTPSGIAMVYALEQIQIIENSLLEQIDETSNMQSGKIRIAIIQSRAALLLPEIVPKYHEKFPNVTFEIISGKTTDFEHLLLSGQLDYYIGINITRNKDIYYQLLTDEKIYLIVSDDILRSFGFTPSDISNFEITGISLDTVKDIPFVVNTKKETLRRVFDELTQNYQVFMNIPLEIDDPQIRATLCMENFCATLFTESMLPYVKQLNRSNFYKGNLNILPLQKSSVSHYCSVIARHKNAYVSNYKRFFEELVIDYYQRIM